VFEEAMREGDEGRGEEAVQMDGSVALADSPAGYDLVVLGGAPVAVEDFPTVVLSESSIALTT
jgi:hypothetical protein